MLSVSVAQAVLLSFEPYELYIWMSEYVDVCIFILTTVIVTPIVHWSVLDTGSKHPTSEVMHQPHPAPVSPPITASFNDLGPSQSMMEHVQGRLQAMLI